MGSSLPTRQAGVAAHLKDPTNNGMRDHDALRPSYQSLTSEYSIATADAIDRNSSSMAYHSSHEIKDLRVQRDEMEQAEIYPPRCDSLHNRGQYNPTPWQDESLQHNRLERRESESQRRGTLDMLNSVVPEVAQSTAPARPKQPQHGQRSSSVPAVRLPPPLPPPPMDVINEKASNQRQRRGPNMRPPPPPCTLAQLSRAASQRSQRQHRRQGSLLQNCRDGNINTDAPLQRRPSLGRRLSDGLQSMGRKLSDAIVASMMAGERRESAAETQNVQHIANSAWYDVRGQPPATWQDLVSLPEAQRRMADMTAEQRLYPAPFGRADVQRSRSLRHERRSIAPLQTLDGPLKFATRKEKAQPEPAEPDTYTNPHRLSGATSFGAVVDAANCKASPMPPPGSQDFPLVPKPLVPVIRRKPVPKRVEPKPPSVERDKTLPPIPPLSMALQDCSCRRPLPDYAHEVLQNEAKSRATVSVRRTCRGNSKGVIYIGIDIEMQDPQKLELPPASLIEESEIGSALGKAERYADGPRSPSSRARANAQERIVDAMSREGRTSWVVRDRSDDSTSMCKWHKRVPKEQQLQPPEDIYTDPATRLMQKLSMERKGEEIEAQESTTSSLTDNVEDASTIWSDPWAV